MFNAIGLIFGKSFSSLTDMTLFGAAIFTGIVIFGVVLNWLLSRGCGTAKITLG